MNRYEICRATLPDQNPEWRDSYAYVDNLDNEAVAFEFLRRNCAYWTAFADAVHGDDPTEWPNDVDLFSLPDAEFPPPIERFGIRKLYDPRRRLTPHARLWAPSVSLTARYIDAIERRQPFSSEYLFRDGDLGESLRVDLLIDAPVEDQIEFVRWLLTYTRNMLGLRSLKKAPRLRRKLFPRYLSLLDARSAGASYPKIANHFHRKNEGAIDLVKKQFKAAVSLRDGGYRNILVWGGLNKTALKCLGNAR